MSIQILRSIVDSFSTTVFKDGQSGIADNGLSKKLEVGNGTDTYEQINDLLNIDTLATGNKLLYNGKLIL